MLITGKQQENNMLLTVKQSLLLLSQYHQPFQRNFLSKLQALLATKHSVFVFSKSISLIFALGEQNRQF